MYFNILLYDILAVNIIIICIKKNVYFWATILLINTTPQTFACMEN